MLPRLARTVALPVPRSDLLCALALCGPLALLLAADKALKLSSADGILSTDLESGIAAVVWHGLLQPAIGSALSALLIAVLAIGALLALLTRRRTRAWVGWSLGIVLVYLAMAAGALMHGEARPWWPFALSQGLRDAAELISLWWRDLAALTLVCCLLSWHLAHRVRGRNLLRRTVVWSIVAIAYALTLADIAFFVATRAALNVDDVYFGLFYPNEAWIVSRGAISTGAALLLLEILLCGLACAVAGLLLARRVTLGRAAAAHAPAARLGLVLWPALALAIAFPAGTHERYGPTADDPLLSVTVSGAETELLRVVVLRRSGAPSAIVPTLHAQAPILAPTAATRPWNVVIVMLESARARDTTVYTPSLNNTPFLAELARESLVVDHMYAVIPRTTDAWLAILAGRYPSSDRVVGDWARQHPLVPSSLARLLRTQGYASAFFLPTTLNFEQDTAVVRALGFDEVVAKESIPEPASGLVTPFGWEDRALLAPIGRWLDQRASDKRPFLLAVMTNIGHAPYGLPTGYAVQRFPSLNEQHEHYLNCMGYIDGYLRDLVQELRDRGLFENTLFLVLGDHGEAFGEHGSFLRADGLHDELLQIPMLVRLPATARRTGHIGGLRQQIDVVPTVADALGLTLKDGALPGRSLLSDPAGHQALFFAQYWDRMAVALRIGELKYIYYFEKDPAETFDLSKDPAESRDIAAQLSRGDEFQARIDMLAWRYRADQTFHVETTRGAIGSEAAGPARIDASQHR